MLHKWNVIFKEANLILKFQIHVISQFSSFIYFMYRLFVCMYVCAPGECLVCVEAKEVVTSFGTGIIEDVGCQWVLGLEHGTSGRTASAFKHELFL